MNVDLLAPSTREMYRQEYVSVTSESPDHKLVIHLLPLPFADYAGLKNALNKIINVVNPILQDVGYKALYCDVDQSKNQLVIYLKKVKPQYMVAEFSPAILAAIIAAIAAVILAFRFLIDGITFMKIAPEQVEIQKSQEQLKQDLTNAWKEGKISTDQYIQAMKAIGGSSSAEQNVTQYDLLHQITSAITTLLPIAMLAMTMYLAFQMIKMFRGARV